MKTQNRIHQGLNGCDTEADAMYAEARRRIQADITEVCEGEGSVIARLTAATQRANRAMRTVRTYEAELCTVFGARGATDLVEQMILMTEAVEKEPGESSVVTAVLETSVEVEEYKLLSKAVMNRATRNDQTVCRGTCRTRRVQPVHRGWTGVPQLRERRGQQW